MHNSTKYLIAQKNTQQNKTLHTIHQVLFLCALVSINDNYFRGVYCTSVLDGIVSNDFAVNVK